MINFEKSFTVLIAKHIPDKTKEKINNKADFISFGDATKVEKALAGAYVGYLNSQGIILSQDEEDNLCDNIEASLKRYKEKAKKQVIS